MRHFIKSRQGYNLLQMSIALLIIGALAAPFSMAYKLYRQNQIIEATVNNMSTVQNALQGYKRNFGIYPCPAPMNIPRTSSAYGNQVNYGAANVCRSAPISTMAAGTCGGPGDFSVCIKQAIPARLAQLNALTPVANPRVIIGAIPFRLLQIDEKNTVDGYGSKIVYAVTEGLTDPATFVEKNGAIAIEDGATPPNSVVTPQGGAAFIIISPGKNQAGAYSRDGIEMNPCTGLGMDLNNCNTTFKTGGGTGVNALFKAMYENDAPGASYFDDNVNYFINQTDELWRRTLADNENIQDLSDNNVLVNISTSTPGVQLDISSKTANIDSIRVNGTGPAAADGKLLIDSVCDYDDFATGTTHCFDPKLIGGDPTTALHCAPNTVMVKIENGTAKCVPLAQISVRCENDSFPLLYGVSVDADGVQTPLCKAMPQITCPANTKMTLCAANDVTLPEAVPGETSSALKGACMNASYKCLDTGWSLDSQKGQCPAVVTGANITNPCGFGYTGQIITATTSTCNGTSGKLTKGTVTISNTCVCTGGSQTNTQSCASDPAFGSNYSGNETRTETKSPPSCASTFTGWNTSACKCGLGTEGTSRWISNGSCPSGYAASPSAPQKEQKISGCKWVDTGNTRGGCACNTADIFTYSDHPCSNSTCQTPNSADRDQYKTSIDASTCTKGTPQLVHAGSCSNLSFKWKTTSTGGQTVSSYPAGFKFDGDACDCASVGTTNSRCFIPTDSSKQIYTCRCQ